MSKTNREFRQLISGIRRKKTAVPDSNILGRDFVIDVDAKNKVKSFVVENNVVIFQNLPPMKQVKNNLEERNIVLRFKMKQCQYIFDIPTHFERYEEKKKQVVES